MSQVYRGILVFSEAPETRDQLLGKAHRVAAGLDVPVSAALLGAQAAASASSLGAQGADCVYTIENPALGQFNVELYSDALAGLVEEIKPEIVLMGATKRGFELGPRLAARLAAACISACVDFGIVPDTHAIEARAMLYSGLGIATYRVKASPVVILVEPNTFAGDNMPGKTAEVIPYAAALATPKLQVLEVRPKASGGASLEKAAAVVDIGQGVRQQEDLALAQGLADQLGAQISCTRPVSSERGWFPDWLGLSGKRVAPRLCITLGVSGAIQHMVGIRGSETIVAVDNSPDSAMLFQADYGVIDDLYQFVPALVRVLKERGVGVV